MAEHQRAETNGAEEACGGTTGVALALLPLCNSLKGKE
jgi:hypothetical protein